MLVMGLRFILHGNKSSFEMNGLLVISILNAKQVSSPFCVIYREG